MNSSPTPPGGTPSAGAVSPDHVDELLSAELDGELDAAATDLGYAPDTVVAQLQTTPGVDARRSALARARDALAAAPDALDELLATRLRSKAVKAADQDRDARAAQRRRARQRFTYAAAGIAAVLVGVVTLGAAIRGWNNNETKATSAAAPTADQANKSTVAGAAAGTVPPPAALAYGNFNSVDAFAAQLQRDQVAKRAAAAYDKNVSIGVGTSHGAALTENGGSTTTAGAEAISAPQPCVNVAHARELADSASVIVRGTVSINHEPLLATIYAQPGRTVVLLLTPQCTFRSQTILR